MRDLESGGGTLVATHTIRVRADLYGGGADPDTIQLSAPRVAVVDPNSPTGRYLERCWG